MCMGGREEDNAGLLHSFAEETIPDIACLPNIWTHFSVSSITGVQVTVSSDSRGKVANDQRQSISAIVIYTEMAGRTED
jgi:hypothetical protein